MSFDPTSSHSNDSIFVFKTFVQTIYAIGAKQKGDIKHLNTILLPIFENIIGVHGTFNDKCEKLSLAVRESLKGNNLTPQDNALCDQLLMFGKEITWENIITLAFIQGGYSVIIDPPMSHDVWHKLGLSKMETFVPVCVMQELDDIAKPLLRRVRRRFSK